MNPPKQRIIIGRNIARLRNIAECTQERLAEMAGIHPTYIQKIEYGKVSVSLEVFIRVRRALKCRWEELLQGID